MVKKLDQSFINRLREGRCSSWEKLCSAHNKEKQEEKQKDVGIGWQCSCLFQHLIEPQVIKVNEVDSIGERCRRRLKGLFPILLERCGPDDNGNVLCCRCGLQHVLEQTGQVVCLAYIGGVLC